MFEDFYTGINDFSQTEIVDLYNNVTAIIKEDCGKCKKQYGKKCNCKKLEKVSRITRSFGKNLEKKMGSKGKAKRKFKKYALSRTKKTIEELKKLPDNTVSFVERSFFSKNETKCSKGRNSVILVTGGNLQGTAAEIYNPLTNSGCSLPPLGMAFKKI